MGERRARIPVDADGRPRDRDSRLHALLADYQDAVVRLRHVDAATTEIVRRRCAEQHDCRICQTLRLRDAMDAPVDSERAATAEALVDAVIWQPAQIDDALVARVRAQFSDAEIAELLLDITKWSTQKINVTLGTDGADRLPIGPDGVTYFGFDDDGRATSFSAVR